MFNTKAAWLIGLPEVLHRTNCQSIPIPKITRKISLYWNMYGCKLAVNVKMGWHGI